MNMTNPMKNSNLSLSSPDSQRRFWRCIGNWRRSLVIGLVLGLTAFLQSAHANTVVLDDDFNDPNNNLGLNTNGIGDGFTSFATDAADVGETNSLAFLSASVAGFNRSSIASIDGIGIN